MLNSVVLMTPIIDPMISIKVWPWWYWYDFNNKFLKVLICWLFSNLIVAQKKVSECQFYQEFIMNYWVYILNNCVVGFIKTHGSVSLGPRKQGTHKRSEYIDRKNKVSIFTYMEICDVWSEWHQISMEAPSTQGRPHSEFEENSSSHFRDTSNRTFERILLIFLLTNFDKIAITCMCVLYSGWSLEHILGV